MINKLIKLANHLDEKGLIKEADYLDIIIKKAEEDSDEEDSYEVGSDELNKLISDFFEVSGPAREDLRRIFYDFLNGYTAYPRILRGESVAFGTFYGDLKEVMGMLHSYIDLSQKIKNGEEFAYDDKFTLIPYSNWAIKLLKRNNLTLTESGANIIIDNLEKIENEFDVHGDISDFDFSQSAGRGDSARNSLRVFSKIIQGRKEELNQYYYGVLEKMRDYSYYNFPRFKDIEGGPRISSEKAYLEIIKLLNEDVGLTYEITVNQILNILKSSK